MELKDEIRTRRKELRMSQYDLAFELIVAPSTVYRWETGSSKPNYRKILAMAKIFGVDKRELLNALKETEDNKKKMSVKVIRALVWKTRAGRNININNVLSFVFNTSVIF